MDNRGKIIRDNRGKIIRDNRGFNCCRCRERLSPKSVNLACSSCKIDFGSIPDAPTNKQTFNNTADGRFSGTLPCVVQKFKNKLLGRNHDQDSDTEKSMSLNCNPSPLESCRSSVRRSRKRALLIGVTYKNSKHELRGTVNDVRNMRSMLIEQFGFDRQNILVLTEYERKPYLIPTKKNIENSLKWLVDDCRYGDSLVFYFSGHGSRELEFENDEVDGFDEAICPVDFMEERVILDNYINSTIVRPLPKGVTLHAIVDACHSGTILDLVHLYNREKRNWEDVYPPNGAMKCTNGGVAICISACEDNQLAADSEVFTEKGMNGALTYILIELVKKYPGLTYGDLLDVIHENIEAINNRGSLFSRILRSTLQNNLLQKPLLSASEPFDVMRKHFHL